MDLGKARLQLRQGIAAGRQLKARLQLHVRHGVLFEKQHAGPIPPVVAKAAVARVLCKGRPVRLPRHGQVVLIQGGLVPGLIVFLR